MVLSCIPTIDDIDTEIIAMHYGIVRGERQRVFSQDFPLILWEYSLSFPPYNTIRHCDNFSIDIVYSKRHQIPGHTRVRSANTVTSMLYLFFIHSKEEKKLTYKTGLHRARGKHVANTWRAGNALRAPIIGRKERRR